MISLHFLLIILGTILLGLFVSFKYKTLIYEHFKNTIIYKSIFGKKDKHFIKIDVDKLILIAYESFDKNILPYCKLTTNDNFDDLEEKIEKFQQQTKISPEKLLLYLFTFYNYVLLHIEKINDISSTLYVKLDKLSKKVLWQLNDNSVLVNTDIYIEIFVIVWFKYKLFQKSESHSEHIFLNGMLDKFEKKTFYEQYFEYGNIMNMIFKLNSNVGEFDEYLPKNDHLHEYSISFLTLYNRVYSETLSYKNNLYKNLIRNKINNFFNPKIDILKIKISSKRFFSNNFFVFLHASYSRTKLLEIKQHYIDNNNNFQILFDWYFISSKAYDVNSHIFFGLPFEYELNCLAGYYYENLETFKSSNRIIMKQETDEIKSFGNCWIVNRTLTFVKRTKTFQSILILTPIGIAEIVEDYPNSQHYRCCFVEEKNTKIKYDLQNKMTYEIHNSAQKQFYLRKMDASKIDVIKIINTTENFFIINETYLDDEKKIIIFTIKTSDFDGKIYITNNCIAVLNKTKQEITFLKRLLPISFSFLPNLQNELKTENLKNLEYDSFINLPLFGQTPPNKYYEFKSKIVCKLTKIDGNENYAQAQNNKLFIETSEKVKKKFLDKSYSLFSDIVTPFCKIIYVNEHSFNEYTFNPIITLDIISKFYNYVLNISITESNLIMYSNTIVSLLCNLSQIINKSFDEYYKNSLEIIHMFIEIFAIICFSWKLPEIVEKNINFYTNLFPILLNFNILFKKKFKEGKIDIYVIIINMIYEIICPDNWDISQLNIESLLKPVTVSNYSVAFMEFYWLLCISDDKDSRKIYFNDLRENYFTNILGEKFNRTDIKRFYLKKYFIYFCTKLDICQFMTIYQTTRRNYINEAFYMIYDEYSVNFFNSTTKLSNSRMYLGTPNEKNVVNWAGCYYDDTPYTQYKSLPIYQKSSNIISLGDCWIIQRILLNTETEKEHFSTLILTPKGMAEIISNYPKSNHNSKKIKFCCFMTEFTAHTNQLNNYITIQSDPKQILTLREKFNLYFIPLGSGGNEKDYIINFIKNNSNIIFKKQVKNIENFDLIYEIQTLNFKGKIYFNKFYMIIYNMSEKTLKTYSRTYSRSINLPQVEDVEKIRKDTNLPQDKIMLWSNEKFSSISETHT